MKCLVDKRVSTVTRSYDGHISSLMMMMMVVMMMMMIMLEIYRIYF
jgi:hypothetical protein